MKIRLYYSCIAVVIIIIGLLYRSSSLTPIVPLSTGDLLYATLIYFLASTISPLRTRSTRATIALLWCMMVELLQLVDWSILNYVRSTLPGRLVLGQGFLWSDFIFYAVGVILGMLVDKRIILKRAVEWDRVASDS